MQGYQAAYLKSRWLSQYDFIPCELCGAEANDIHHIHSSFHAKRTFLQNWWDLIALCRDCHNFVTKKATPVMRENLSLIVGENLNRLKNSEL